MEARKLERHYNVTTTARERLANHLTRGRLFVLVANAIDSEEELKDAVYVMSKMLLGEADPDMVAQWLLEHHGDRMAAVLKEIEYARINHMAERRRRVAGTA